MRERAIEKERERVIERENEGEAMMDTRKREKIIRSTDSEVGS